MPTPLPRELRTLVQAAEERPFLTLRWLRQLVASERVPTYKLGGKVLIDLHELDEFVRASRRPAKSQNGNAA